MTRLIIPTLATLLLATSCCPHKRPCANRYCPPTAPTRPICPEATPNGGCQKKQAKPGCGCKKRHAQPRKAVPLSEVTNYLPGIAPDYLSI